MVYLRGGKRSVANDLNPNSPEGTRHMKLIGTMLAPALLALVLAGSGCSSPPHDDEDGASAEATPAATESAEESQDRDEQEDR